MSVLYQVLKERHIRKSESEKEWIEKRGLWRRQIGHMNLKDGEEASKDNSEGRDESRAEMKLFDCARTLDDTTSSRASIQT